MTVVLFPSSSNMYQAMLRQLLWVCITCILSSDASYIFNPDFDPCNMTQCIPLDNDLVNNVDHDLEPCDDFLKYACGNKLSQGGDRDRHLPKPDDISDLLAILQDEFLETSPANIPSLEIEREIYQKCLKNGISTQRELNAYRDTLSSFGADRLEHQHGDHYLYETNDVRWAWKDLEYAKMGLGSAFFDIDIVEAYEGTIEPPKRYIQISAPSDSILDINDLLSSKYMNRPGGKAGEANYADKEKYQQLKKFINNLNNIRPNEEDPSKKAYPRTMNISQWQKEYDGFGFSSNNPINWFEYLKEWFTPIYYRLHDHEDIVVKDENYFRGLARVLQSVDYANTIVDYIHLRFVSKTIGFVDKNYQDKYAIIPSVKGLKCTPGLLVGTAHYYSRYNFPEGAKDILVGIFNNLKDTMRDNLGSVNEMDAKRLEATKTFLIQLKNANAVIGYPSWVSNETIALDFYGSDFPPISDKYHRNQFEILARLFKNKLKSYKSFKYPIFKMKEFFKSVTQDRIEFSSNLEEIVIPARLFSEKRYQYFSDQIYASINYGSAGTAIAYELYMQYLNRIGYDRNATHCIKQQVPKLFNIQKKNFLLKSTAYLMALNATYDIWLTKGSYPIEFPKFGAVTDYRLFFLTFAQSLCRLPAQREDMLPPRNFINIAVSSHKGFQHAFRCYEHHAMNRRHKCDPLKYP